MLSSIIKIFNHLRLCLATAIYNLKWLKITHIYLIWDKTFKILMFKQQFHFQYQWFYWLIKQQLSWSAW